MSNEPTTASGATPRPSERADLRPGVTMREGAARLRVVVAPCRKCGGASIEGSIYCEPCEEIIIGAAVRSWCADIVNNTRNR